MFNVFRKAKLSDQLAQENAKLQADVERYKGEYHTAVERAERMAADRDNIAMENADLNETITNLRGEAAELQAKLTEVDETIDGLRSDFATVLSDMGQTIKAPKLKAFVDSILDGYSNNHGDLELSADATVRLLNVLRTANDFQIYLDENNYVIRKK